MNSLERIVPVPPCPQPASSYSARSVTADSPPLALCDAIRAGRIPVGDRPEIIANIWTWDDSPTSDLGEADWLVIFRAPGFFSCPSLVVRQPDGTAVPLPRPSSAVTRSTGEAVADRMRRMSWTCERDLAQQL